MSRTALLAAALVASAALAQPEQNVGQSWSTIGARTAGPGGNVIEVAAGFPGASVAYLRGVAPGLNLGVRVAFTYGVEGLTREIIPGAKFQGLLKLRFFDAERISLALTFEPGPFFHAPAGLVTRAGFSLPVGLRLGIAASSAVGLALLFEVPLWLEFGANAGVNLPILSGVGIEYFLTSEVGLFFRTRIGPTIRFTRPAELTFDGMLGVGFKF